MNFDLNGKPVPQLPKCKHCGKTKLDHRAKTAECPRGMKHRTVGYTSYGPTTFEPKTKGVQP